MNRTERVEGAKLELFEALIRSQKALSRMLEAAADVVEASPETARAITENMTVLCRYQRILVKKLTGVTFRRIRRGKLPSPPWLNGEENVTGGE